MIVMRDIVALGCEVVVTSMCTVCVWMSIFVSVYISVDSRYSPTIANTFWSQQNMSMCYTITVCTCMLLRLNTHRPYHLQGIEKTTALFINFIIWTNSRARARAGSAWMYTFFNFAPLTIARLLAGCLIFNHIALHPSLSFATVISMTHVCVCLCQCAI